MQKNASTHFRPAWRPSMARASTSLGSEVDENAAWHTTRIKSVTGGDIHRRATHAPGLFQLPAPGRCLDRAQRPARPACRDGRISPGGSAWSHSTNRPSPSRSGILADARWQKPENVAQVVRWTLEGARVYAETGLPDCPAVSKETKRYLHCHRRHRRASASRNSSSSPDPPTIGCPAQTLARNAARPGSSRTPKAAHSLSRDSPGCARIVARGAT